MSQQITFEIEKFNGEKSLILDLDSFVFPQFSHLGANTVGATRSVKVTELDIIRVSDKYSPLLFNQIGKSFPKATLSLKNSDGKSYIYTFVELTLDDYKLYSNGSEKNSERIRFFFIEFSVK